MTQLTRDQGVRMDRLAAEHEQKAETYDLAGRTAEAERERDVASALRERLEASNRAHRAEESRQRDTERRQRETQEARDRAEKEAEAEAVAFLEKLLAPSGEIAASAVLSAAEEEGIERRYLQHAAAALGLREMGWPRTGTRHIVDHSRGTCWGHPSPYTGMIDAGPARLPAA